MKEFPVEISNNVGNGGSAGMGGRDHWTMVQWTWHTFDWRNGGTAQEAFNVNMKLYFNKDKFEFWKLSSEVE